MQQTSRISYSCLATIHTQPHFTLTSCADWAILHLGHANALSEKIFSVRALWLTGQSSQKLDLYLTQSTTASELHRLQHGRHSNAPVQRRPGQGIHRSWLALISWCHERIDPPWLYRGERSASSAQWSAGWQWAWSDTRNPSCHARGEPGTQWHYAHATVCILLSDLSLLSEAYLTSTIKEHRGDGQPRLPS